MYPLDEMFDSRSWIAVGKVHQRKLFLGVRTDYEVCHDEYKKNYVGLLVSL